MKLTSQRTNDHFGLYFNLIQTAWFELWSINFGLGKWQTTLKTSCTVAMVKFLPFFFVSFHLFYMRNAYKFNQFIYSWLSFAKCLLGLSCLDFVTYRENEKLDLNWFKTEANDMQIEAITCVKYCNAKRRQLLYAPSQTPHYHICSIIIQQKCLKSLWKPQKHNHNLKKCSWEKRRQSHKATEQNGKKFFSLRWQNIVSFIETFTSAATDFNVTLMFSINITVHDWV